MNCPQCCPISRAAQESAAFSRKLVSESVASQLEALAAGGATIITPEIGPFREAVASVYDKAREVYGAEVVDAVLADAEALRAAN